MSIRLGKIILFGKNNIIVNSIVFINKIIGIVDILNWIFNGFIAVNTDIGLDIGLIIILGLFTLIISLIYECFLRLQQYFLFSLPHKIKLEITPKTFLLTSNGMKLNQRNIEVSTELIKPILSFLGLPMGENPITNISLKKKLSKNGFCKLRSRLTQDEKEWLAWEINNYLKDKNINT